MPPKRVLCKFFAHGACLKGDHCEFSHDWKDPPNNICTYYQKGMCSYGSRCRYEHVKPSRTDSSASSSSSSTVLPQSVASNSVPPVRPARIGSNRASAVLGASPELSASSRSFVPVSKQPAWKLESEEFDFLENGDVIEPRYVKPADRALCSFAAAGDCPRGDKCPHIHGDLCPTCGKHCLHPFRADEREEHLRNCEKKQKHLDALKCSQEIECCVCLDKVLSKPTAAERKFGLLSECDHPFCISCIRNWRSSSPTSGMESFRACPICRKVSYFVIPSVIWYSSPEEKQEIVENYKAKLRSIDCKHFDFGNGNCPFGTSCFYKHFVKRGSYAWKFGRPPPRRPRPHRSNVVDMDAFYDVFEHLVAQDELDIFDEEDYFDEDLSPMDMALLLMHLDFGPSDDSTDEENYL